MKKNWVICLTLILFITTLPACAHRCNHYHHRSYSGSNYVYLIKKEQSEVKSAFANCKEHLLVTNTTINYYSDGTRRVYKVYSVLNKDGAEIISDAYDIKHIIYNNKHYFIAKRSKRYKIFDANGKILNIREYSFMEELAPNKLLVKCNKKFGVININENIVVPLKYQKFEKVGADLYLTKLNGYYGFLNSDNKILLKNEYDKIKPLMDTYVLKFQGKYGLADINGKIILPPNYDKIRALGEYILVKNNAKYGLLDYSGKYITAIEYDKIKLNRNNLEVKKDKQWSSLFYGLENF